MSGDRRPGAPGPSGPEEENDVVVPQRFGPVATGEQSVPPAAAPASEAEQIPDDAAGGTAPDGGEDAAVAEARDDDEPDAGESSADEAESEDEPSAAEPAETEPPQAEPDAVKTPQTVVGKSETVAEAGPRRRKRDPLAAALIGVLTLLLGFAFAVQVRSADDTQQLAGAREEDLVRILDELNAREERLRAQLADQRGALQQLTNSDSQSEAALEEARQRAEAIGILNGTIAAEGPGLEMVIRDPEDAVRVADVLDAIQELRGAGAETMQIDGIRIGVSSAVTGQPGDLMVDGRPITAPYEFIVIGDPQGMETAMNIPGGVVQDMTRIGGSAAIQQSDSVVVDALRPLDTPQYASPATGD
jgi:uncharacterized protein YlxW (UPF0749 family)